jgi:outer membrane protein assembly factor BamA
MRARNGLNFLAADLIGVLVVAVVANVVCRAESPAPPTATKAAERVMVADVVIQSTRLVPTQMIMRLLQTKPNTEYRDEVVQEDVRTLVATRQFLNIEAVKRTEPDGRVIVCFLFRDYPCPEDVQYLGAKHLSEKDLDRLTGVRKNESLFPLRNKKGCQAIAYRLQEDGRPFATCVLLSGDKLGDTKVIFQITEGPKVGLRSVSYRGNQWASRDRLLDQIASKPILGIFPGKYDPQMVDADVGGIQAYYRAFGFFDVSVASEITLTPDGEDIELTMHIQEGPRYTIRNVPDIGGIKSLPKEEITALSRMQAGQFYDQAAIDSDVNRIEMYYDHSGYAAKVVPCVFFDKSIPSIVTVQYEVSEGDPLPYHAVVFGVGGRKEDTSIGMPLAEREHLLREGAVRPFNRANVDDDAATGGDWSSRIHLKGSLFTLARMGPAKLLLRLCFRLDGSPTFPFFQTETILKGRISYEDKEQTPEAEK